MLIFWSLVRNSVVLAVYLLFSVACFLTVHEHLLKDSIDIVMQYEFYVNAFIARSLDRLAGGAVDFVAGGTAVGGVRCFF